MRWAPWTTGACTRRTWANRSPRLPSRVGESGESRASAKEERVNKDQVSAIVSVVLSALVALLRAFGYDVEIAGGSR